jgi:hypothetical protein
MALNHKILIVAYILVLVGAHVVRDFCGLEYANLEAQRENLPLLKLPYGTWQATRYDPASDVRT